MKSLELYKNKTGKHFIFIDEISKNKILVITPTPRLIPIEIETFKESFEIPERDAIAKGYITEAQKDKNIQYWKNRSGNENEKRIDFFIIMPPFEQKKFLDELSEIHSKGKS